MATLHRRLRLLVAVVAVLAVTLTVPAVANPAATAEPVAEESGVLRAAALLESAKAEGDALIRIMAGAFDPLADEPPEGQQGFGSLAEADLAPGQAAYWLVQAQAPDYAGTVDALEGAGAVIVGSLRGGVYAARATAQQRAVFDADDAVRWSGLYQPGWKVPLALGEYEALVDLEGPQTYLVYSFDDADGRAETAAALADVARVRLTGRDGRVTEVQATSNELPAIAAIPSVEWIEAKPTVVPMNMEARWVNDTGVRDVQWTMVDGRLTGAGQTAGVADTGVNYTTDNQGRALSYFRDCDGDDCKLADWTQATPGNAPDALNDVIEADTDHRKMAAYFDLGASGPQPSDDSAHGSHVSGSVAGDTAEGGGEWGTWDRADGMAPAARLVHQNIATPGGGLSTPTDTYRLFAQAYRPRDPAAFGETGNRPALQTPRDPATYADDSYVPDEDARTHNNSYGLIVPSISAGSAEAADRFVWDHEDMVIVSSAGNAGPKAFSIGAPSIGTNVVTSGASANGRQPMASIDTMASFSSHGPTADGRLGVDLATPGQIVVSAKGGSDDDEHYLQGTSMSGPILTGLATLVRQYFWDGYGPGKTTADATASGFSIGAPDDARRHNPSAALVRAAMVNGADRMRGYYTGDDGQNRLMDGQYPSAGQGFGLVNLRNSLFFDDEQGRSELSTWFHDVYRGDDAAFDVGFAQTRSFQLDVAEDTPLSVTLAYTDAPGMLTAGTPTTDNDLDVILTSPHGETFYGNNFNTRVHWAADEYRTEEGDIPDLANFSTRNPVERVRIPEPAAGTWTVTVRANQVITGPQGFALAANGRLTDVGAAAFEPGPPLQTDEAGDPAISGVEVEHVSADLLKLRWTTDEPTTGTVTTTVGDEQVTYIDSYNVDPGDGFYGIDEAQVESSAAYGDRPVLGTQHEAYLTGLSPDETYQLRITATDIAGNETNATHGATTSEAIFGAEPPDIGQLTQDNTDPIVGPVPVLGGSGWKTGTQLYAGPSGGAGLLGAFMFRLPESLDPDRIAGAAVELTSAHVLSNLYAADAHYFVDLLDESVEPEWGTQTYSEIHNAPALTRTSAETGYRRGGGKIYPFTFTCGGLDELRTSLETVADGERRAAFRFDALSDAATALFSTEFGFNRRSKGPDLRPRLVLYLDDGSGTIVDPVPAEPAGDAPVISELGVQEGIEKGSVTVTWRTDIPSDSLVLYREKGTSAFTQVGSRSRSTVHMVQVFGLDREKEYEFAVRSESPGGVTIDDNAGEAYDFFRPLPGDVEQVDWFFHGEPTDEAQKTEQFGGRTTATFNRDEPTGEPPVVQKTTGLANMSFVANPLTAYWTGDYSGELNGPLTFDAYFSTTGPPRTGAVNITVFADPDFDGDPVQPNKIVASGSMKVALGPVPQRSVGTIEVKDGQQMVDTEMLVQIGGAALTDGDLLIEYDSPSTPSKFQVPVSPPPVSDEVLPKIDPTPPPSAEADSFDASAVAIRTEPAPRDVAAGTGLCVSALADEPVDPEDPDDPEDPKDPKDPKDPDDGDGGDDGVGDADDDRSGDPEPNDRTLPAADDTGPLAVTGASVLLLLTIAALALALGTGAVRLSGRRRRAD